MFLLIGPNNRFPLEVVIPLALIDFASRKVFPRLFLPFIAFSEPRPVSSEVFFPDAISVMVCILSVSLIALPVPLSTSDHVVGPESVYSMSVGWARLDLSSDFSFASYSSVTIIHTGSCNTIMTNYE